MELKKNPKVDLQNKRGLLLEIGLIISLIAVIAAFTYTPREHRIEQVDINYGPIEEQITEITRQDLKTPPPPKKVEVKVITDLLQVVTNDTKVEVEVDFAEFEEDTEIIQQVAEKEEVIEDEVPLLFAEVAPSFNGGDINTFHAWVQGQLKYPAIAQENGLQGQVIITFVVEKDGKVGRVQALTSPDQSLADEAIRVLQSSPVWTPARMGDKTVALKYTIPVVFVLQ